MPTPFDRALRAAARRGRQIGACPDAASLAAYADGTLESSERRQVEAHASQCPSCLQHLALLGSLTTDAPRRRRGFPWLTRWPWLVPALTAVVLVAVWASLPGDLTEPRPSKEAAEPTMQRVPEAFESDRRADAPADERDAAEASPPSRRQAAGNATGAAPDAKRRFARSKETIAAPEASTPTAAAGEVRQEQAGARDRSITGSGLPSAPAAPPAPAAPAPVPPEEQQAPALGDAAASRAQGRTAEGRAESLMEKAAGQAPLVVSATPDESYRALEGRIERSTDGGESWREVYSNPQLVVTAASCAPGGSCWFAGAGGHVIRATAEGVTASVLPVAAPAGAIAAEGADTALVTLDNGVRFRTIDGGRTWQAVRGAGQP